MLRMLTTPRALLLAPALIAFGLAGTELAACSSAEPARPASIAPDAASTAPSGSGSAADTPNADAAIGDAGAEASPLPPCTVQLPTSCPTPPTTYEDILPVLTSRCLTCHSGSDPNGPWPLTDYSHVADWQDAVRAEVGQCTMPPADAGFVMSDAERLVLLNWVRCGAPK